MAPQPGFGLSYILDLRCPSPASTATRRRRFSSSQRQPAHRAPTSRSRRQRRDPPGTAHSARGLGSAALRDLPPASLPHSGCNSGSPPQKAPTAIRIPRPGVRCPGQPSGAVSIGSASDWRGGITRWRPAHSKPKRSLPADITFSHFVRSLRFGSCERFPRTASSSRRTW